MSLKGTGAYREERGLGESVDPILVPELVQEMCVESGLEVGDLQGVVLLAVNTKVLNLAQRNSLVLRRAFIRCFVSLLSLIFDLVMLDIAQDYSS